MKSKRRIFKKGSTTYYNSSVFFPKEIRKDVFTLYAYVRTADDLVDSVPQKKQEFLDFKEKTYKALKGKITGNEIIDDFASLYKKKEFRKSWVEAFLKAMQSDLKKVRFKKIEETNNYIYGSAEVIGLFMAKIMNLEKKAYASAMMLGKAMQYINFIRDVKEDALIGRTYLPLEEAEKHGLKNLEIETIQENPGAFKKFMKTQIKIFYEYDKKARKGFKHIPKKYLAPIKTAQDMYCWTASKINKDPLIVLRKKVKPKKHRIILTMIKNILTKK